MEGSEGKEGREGREEMEGRDGYFIAQWKYNGLNRLLQGEPQRFA